MSEFIIFIICWQACWTPCGEKEKSNLFLTPHTSAWLPREVETPRQQQPHINTDNNRSNNAVNNQHSLTNHLDRVSERSFPATTASRRRRKSLPESISPTPAHLRMLTSSWISTKPTSCYSHRIVSFSRPFLVSQCFYLKRKMNDFFSNNFKE